MSNLLLKLAAQAARSLPESWIQAIYRSPRLANMIRGELNRASPQGLVPVQIAAGSLQGDTLLLDMQTEKDYWLGVYEPNLQQAIKDLVQPGWVVYDVGANIGYISLIFARAVSRSGHVYAFEALPDNFARVQENIRLNSAQDTITPVHAAVIEADKPVNFLVGPSNGMGKVAGSAGRQEIVYEHSLTVPGISLDEYVFGQGHPAPNVVKMDIEGGEVLALPGMQRILQEAHPLLLLELHGPESASLARRILTEAGYHLHSMAAGYPEVLAEEALDWKAYLIAR
ncbi:MAG TPA: FkbM family methyltransferase [Anaerolineales bacterium]|nr:FkbM family methyltransferase [Anaerolineales bacterium]